MVVYINFLALLWTEILTELKTVLTDNHYETIYEPEVSTLPTWWL